MKNRQGGYYWVEDKEGYQQVAWYDDLPHPFKPDIIGYWHLCCSEKDILDDEDFVWISNKPLTPPKKKR